MTAGHFAPRDRSSTGVADYAEALHRALQKQGQGLQEQAKIRWDDSSGVPLYHIGNNHLHREIYRRAIEYPGVVILHDAVLHHFLLGALTEHEYIDEFEYNYGRWSRAVAERLWKRRAQSAANPLFFEYPLIRRIVERAKATIVHNPRAAALVRNHVPTAQVEIVPHLFDVPVITGPNPPFANGTVFGVFGHLRESKRLFTVVKALQEVPHASLLISGKFVSRDYERALASELQNKRITIHPFASEAEFWKRARSIDVCVNLRSPSVGETSGITVRMMGIGKPVIVTTDGEGCDYPEGTCATVDSGLPEREMLSATMSWLSSSASDRAAMGRLAQKHIEEHHTPDRVASRIWKILQTIAMLFMLVLPARSAVTRFAMVPMRDGVRLATNIFLPSDKGRYPVLLVRTPYGKGGELSPQFRPFVDHGYAFVIQDVRGRYASEGVFRPLTQEVNDGEDTLRWIERQKWFGSGIGMLGGSYVGLVQWKASATGISSLKAIFPVHAGVDEYLDRFYSRGGAFRLGHRMLWLAQNMRVPLFQSPPFEKYTRHVPLRTIDLTATGHRLDLLQKALDHPEYDGFWRSISMREKLTHAPLPPAFVVSGWYDPNVQSDLEWFAAIQKGSRVHRLVVGPWAHNMSIPFSGIDYGREAHYAVRSAQLAWFDHYLKGKLPLPIGGPVTLFVMGINRWRDEKEWPLKRAVERKFYLATNGHLANSPGKNGKVRYTYDPRNPVPTRGGNTCCDPKIFPWGPMDQRPVERRPDVLTYTTEVLKEDLEVTGTVLAQLFVETSAPDTDFTAKLVDIFPSGESRNLTDGILRLRYREGMDKAIFAKAGEIYEITIDAGVTSNVFLAGHRLGVEISSSNFPKYDRNPNSGRLIAVEKNWLTAEQTIHVGRRHPSHILLPVVSSK